MEIGAGIDLARSGGGDFMNSPPTILVCDDEASLRELVRAIVGADYTLIEAADGFEALDLARERHLDLVVLDMMLPGKSGLEVLRELRDDPALGNPPVIVITAWSHAGEEALTAGADHFLPKPFEPDELSATIEELLLRR